MSDAESGTVSETIDLQGIMELIPHRYPMLLIDRVEKVKLDNSAVGIKNVTFNEHFFQGHFPAKPVMPGVLIIEAMAQTAAVLAARTMGDDARGSSSISCPSNRRSSASRSFRATCFIFMSPSCGAEIAASGS